MGLRDLFRRRQHDTAPIEALEEAQQARDRIEEAAAVAKQQNDRLESRIAQNHFGEALVAAWTGRSA